MAGKREKPEDIVSKLRQVEVLEGQGATIAEAVGRIGRCPDRKILLWGFTVLWPGFHA